MTSGPSFRYSVTYESIFLMTINECTCDTSPSMYKKFETPIFFKTLIRKSPEEIFKLISTADGWNSWFTTQSVFELGNPNSKLVWENWGADKVNVTAKVEILEISPSSVVKFDWNFGLKNGPTQVTLELIPHPQGTVLQVTENNYPDTKEGHEAIIECSTGWGEALSLIRIYAENKIHFK